jgi:hypothetical protein
MLTELFIALIPMMAFFAPLVLVTALVEWWMDR